jgi:hypothetical protein
MNHSIYSADRTTHLKVVIVALIAGILVAGFGISMRNSSDEGLTQTARVESRQTGDGHNVEQKRKIVKEFRSAAAGRRIAAPARQPDCHGGAGLSAG